MANTQRRQRQLARERYERRRVRLASKAAQHRRWRRIGYAVLAAIAVLASGAVGMNLLTGRNSGQPDASASTAAPSPASDQVAKVCATPPAARPATMSFPKEPALTIDGKKPYTATLKTNCGDVTVALAASAAPRTVNSFAFLAGRGYFDHTPCHRLTTQGIYVLQCGDPTGTGTGGPGYRFADEHLTGATYPAGTLAMANSGPNTNGSQFFLVYADTQLPPQYTVFGKITAGMDVLTKIAGAGTTDGSGDGRPKEPVVLERVTVTPKA